MSVSTSSAPGDPDPSAGLAAAEGIAAAAAAFGRASSVSRLLGVGWRLFVVSGGRLGRLTFSPRRLSQAMSAAARLGAADGAAADQFSERELPVTAGSVIGFGASFEHGAQAALARARGRAREAVIRAGSWLGLASLDLALVVVVVFTVDLMLNLPLVARLSRSAGETEIHVAAAGIALLLVLAGHWMVHDTPAGLRARTRTRLVIAAAVGMGMLLAAGSFLRGRNPGGSNKTTPPLTPGIDGTSWSELLGPSAVLVAGIGLLVLTWAVSALASLGRATATARLTADGPRARITAVRADGLDRAVGHLVEHGHALTSQLAATHLAGFCAAAHPDLADRTRPYSIPARTPAARPTAPAVLTV